MSNFTEPHSVSGIIGVPPGYVGHETGGALINDLNADPYGVFLLDEAEKAHPNVWKPFLNLFDEGWIVDQRGVKAYADRAIFILTTSSRTSCSYAARYQLAAIGRESRLLPRPIGPAPGGPRSHLSLPVQRHECSPDYHEDESPTICACKTGDDLLDLSRRRLYGVFCKT